MILLQNPTSHPKHTYLHKHTHTRRSGKDILCTHTCNHFHSRVHAQNPPTLPGQWLGAWDVLRLGWMLETQRGTNCSFCSRTYTKVKVAPRIQRRPENWYAGGAYLVKLLPFFLMPKVLKHLARSSRCMFLLILLPHCF